MILGGAGGEPAAPPQCARGLSHAMQKRCKDSSVLDRGSDDDRCVRGKGDVALGDQQRMVERKSIESEPRLFCPPRTGTEEQGVLAANGGSQSLSMQVRGCASKRQ